MRTTFPCLLLASCTPTLWTAPADAAPGADLPPVVVRDCYGGPPDARRGVFGGAIGLGSSSSGYGAGGGGLSTRSNAAPPAAPAPSAAAEAAPAQPLTKEFLQKVPAGRSYQDAVQLSAGASAGGDGVAMDEERAEARSDRDDARRIVQTPRPSGAAVDWGGTVHLSNDDTASLASAQRLLWALDQGAPFTVDQIRPHELLNYFTFDTTPPRLGDMFSVTPSAELEGDELSLALAVRAWDPPRPPMDLTLLVDRSGSMQAEGRMDYTRRALQLASRSLKPGDRVDLVLFDDEVCTPLEGFVAGRDDPALLARALERMQPRGSTDLDRGLEEAYRVARGHRLASRQGRVMVFTDAMLNTGDVDPHTVSEVGRALDADGIRLTGVGVGHEFRDDVLDRLTEKGKGAYVFLGSERVVDRLFGQGFDAMVHAVALDVRFSLDLPPSLGMTRFYGEESSRDPEEVQPVTVHAGARQVFLQDLAVRDGRLRRDEEVTLNIAWTHPDNGRRFQQTWTGSVGDLLRTDPHAVRKARALSAWSDVLLARAMGAPTCGPELATLRQRLHGVADDVELTYATGLLRRWCGDVSPLPRPAPSAHLKVRVDADVHISEVSLACSDGTRRVRLTASDTVASFDASPGACDLTLHGAVPMVARVDLPRTGTDLNCTARGGRLACR